MPPIGHVLVADDDPAVGRVLVALLEQAQIEAQHVPGGREALAALNARPFDVLVTDLRMPGMDGMQLLSEVAGAHPEVAVILISAHGTIPLAVEAMKLGAADFVLKPFDREELLYVIRKAIAAASGRANLVPPLSREGSRFVGHSAAMDEVHAVIQRAAAATATVLIRGESGTGKELAARATHALGPRARGPFIKFQCSALPESLLESELFGYEKGAFTGATCRKPGRVELAQGGTLFLDEIGDLTPQMQIKLLRLLQDREFERLGGISTQKSDARFVAATHRHLEEMVRVEEFREDLFYRLNVIPIWLPPLRARTDEIEELARHFCTVFGKANGKPGTCIEPAGMTLLRAQPWPGNVRQLQNFVERLVVLSEGTSLSEADVERELDRERRMSLSSPAGGFESEGTLDEKSREAERSALASALRRANNNRTLAARLLGVSRRTLYNKLQEFGLL